jgi:hypothetical protein
MQHTCSSASRGAFWCRNKRTRCSQLRKFRCANEGGSIKLITKHNVPIALISHIFHIVLFFDASIL